MLLIDFTTSASALDIVDSPLIQLFVARTDLLGMSYSHFPTDPEKISES